MFWIICGTYTVWFWYIIVWTDCGGVNENIHLSSIERKEPAGHDKKVVPIFSCQSVFEASSSQLFSTICPI